MVVADPKGFHVEIERIVCERSCEYMEALIIFRDAANVEIETVSSLVRQNPILKAKLQEEAEGLRLVKASGNRLKF